MRVHAGRVSAFFAVSLVAAACSAPTQASPPQLLPVVDAAPGELRTLFTIDDVVDEDVDRFGLSDAFPLPDGTVAVSYDLATPEAGSDTGSRSRVAILGRDGVLEAIDLPEVAGAAVDPGATLLATAPDGTIYVWDREPDRLVARDPDGSWRVLPVELAMRYRYAPLAAVGPDGALYLCDDNEVLRLDAGGTATRLVRVTTGTSYNSWVPELPVEDLPLPAQSLVLARPWGLAVGEDGTVYVSNSTEIVAIDPTGMLSLVTRFSDLQADLGIHNTSDPPFLWSSLAFDGDGSLLVSDNWQQLVARVSEPTLLVHDAALVSNGQNAAFSPTGDLLVRLLDPNSRDAGPDDPHRLAAYGG